MHSSINAVPLAILKSGILALGCVHGHGASLVFRLLLISKKVESWHACSAFRDLYTRAIQRTEDGLLRVHDDIRSTLQVCMCVSVSLLAHECLCKDRGSMLLHSP
jgi:hypothetical protein